MSVTMSLKSMPIYCWGRIIMWHSSYQFKEPINTPLRFTLLHLIQFFLHQNLCPNSTNCTAFLKQAMISLSKSTTTTFSILSACSTSTTQISPFLKNENCSSALPALHQTHRRWKLVSRTTGCSLSWHPACPQCWRVSCLEWTEGSWTQSHPAIYICAELYILCANFQMSLPQMRTYPTFTKQTAQLQFHNL